MSENDGPEPDFDDPSYADLRALLGSAGGEETVPDDVAARLDATLADLVAERAPASPDVVPLVAKRRWTTRLLPAAAAVVLLGAGSVGISQVMKDTGADDAASSAVPVTTPEMASSGDGGAVTRDSDAEPESAPAVPPASQPGVQNGGGQLAASKALTSLTRFTAAQFSTQATTLVRVARDDGLWTASYFGGSADANGKGNQDGTGASDPDAPGPADAPAPATGTDSGSGGDYLDEQAHRSPLLTDTRYRATAQCPGPVPTDGSVVLRITFGGRPAALVLHRPVEGSQFVAAWSCDATRLLAYTTVQLTR